MKTLPALAATVFLFAFVHAQDMPDTVTVPHLPLSELLREAVLSNPEIAAARAGADVFRARSRQAGTLMDIELTYKREDMPGFRWDEAMMETVELMQSLPFPSKLSGESAAARLTAESSEEAFGETVNEMLAQVSATYVAYWYAGESLRLNDENELLLNRFLEAARARYAVSAAGIQDVLKASIELSMIRNERTGIEAASSAAQAKLGALLGRPDTTFSGLASLPEFPDELPSAEALESLMLRARPMVRRDSLMVEAELEMATVARASYLPDLRLGLMYRTAPAGDFRGWGVSAGVSLPFAPWSLGRIAGKVEESEAAGQRARAQYASGVAMARASVRELRAAAASGLKQLGTYRSEILPAADQAVKAGITAYQTGDTDILSLLDSFRTYIRLRREALDLRTDFEQTRVELERTVGLLAARTLRAERLLP